MRYRVLCVNHFRKGYINSVHTIYICVCVCVYDSFLVQRGKVSNRSALWLQAIWMKNTQMRDVTVILTAFRGPGILQYLEWAGSPAPADLDHPDDY